MKNVKVSKNAELIKRSQRHGPKYTYLGAFW